MVEAQSAFPPPPYNPHTQDGASYPPPKQYPTPANMKPANFIRISSYNSVRGVWIIDPELMPPVSLRSFPPDHEDQKNALIESKQGNLNADIFVVPSPHVRQSKVCMELNSWNGPACIRVHDAEPQSGPCIRKPLNIVVNAGAKKADVYIPRSFNGPLELVTGEMGKVCYSKAVKAQITPGSSVNGTHKCFIGEYGQPDWNGDRSAWPGDELQVDAKEVINLYYDDEGDIPTKDTSENECIVM